MNEPRLLPSWAEEMRRRYLRGEATMFVLHGNVYDVVLSNKQMMALPEFLTGVLLKDSKDTIAVYNLATGVRFSKRADEVKDLDDLLLATEKDRIFRALERLLVGSRTLAPRPPAAVMEATTRTRSAARAMLRMVSGGDPVPFVTIVSTHRKSFDCAPMRFMNA